MKAAKCSDTNAICNGAGNGIRKEEAEVPPPGKRRYGRGVKVAKGVYYTCSDTHTKASTDLRLCLLTLFQVDGATHAPSHTLTHTLTHTCRRYTLFGSGAQAPRTTATTTLPNSKCRGGNY